MIYDFFPLKLILILDFNFSLTIFTEFLQLQSYFEKLYSNLSLDVNHSIFFYMTVRLLKIVNFQQEFNFVQIKLIFMSQNVLVNLPLNNQID